MGRQRFGGLPALRNHFPAEDACLCRALVHQRIRHVRAPTHRCRPCIVNFLKKNCTVNFFVHERLTKTGVFLEEISQ